MYILTRDGQDAFSNFMNTLIGQVFLGSICIFLLYVHNLLPFFNLKGIVRLIVCIVMWGYLIFWCFCSFTKFIRPLSNELNLRIEELKVQLPAGNSFIQTCTRGWLKVKFAWEFDKVIFWQILRLFLAIELPAIFLILAASVGAAQIAKTLGY